MRARCQALAAAALVLAAAAAAAAPLAVAPGAPSVSATEGVTASVTLPQPEPGAAWLAETSSGSIGAVAEEGGRLSATLRLPPDDMPRATLVVLTPQEREGLSPAWRVVPVSVRTTLTARTEPRSSVSATVGGRTFGPVEAARDGSFSLDVELPPGAREARVRLQDPAGNVTEQSVPVPQRAHDPLTVTVDRYRVTSDGAGHARVFAFAFDDAGRPVEGTVEATASRGEISAFEQQEPGLFVARYSAPKDGSEGAADLEVTLKRAGRKDEREIERLSIVRGLPGTLKLEADPLQIVAGRTEQVRLVARVADAAGHPLAGQPVKLFADRGELSELEDRKDGTYAAVLRPPALVESGSLEVKAILPVGGPARRPANLRVTADPKAVPTSWRAFSLVTAEITDSEGLPVPGEIVLFHLSRGDGRVTPAAITYERGQAFADFAADETEEIVTIEAVSTTDPSLRASVSIEKRASGQFAIVSRPAVVARGGQGAAVLVLSEDKRILQDAVVLEMVAGDPARLLASADPSRLPADGQSQSVLSARLLDAQGNPVREQALSWSADRGTTGSDSESDEGEHQAAFTAPEGRGSGRAIVTVSHAGSGLSAQVPIELDLGPPARIALDSDVTELPADGVSRAILTATVQDASGAPIPGVSVAFTASGAETAIDPSATTDEAGRARATLVASTEAGDAEVEAQADGGLVATAALRLLPLRPERLIVTASPSRIAADGTDRSEILTIVEDGLGQRLADERLTLRVLGEARLTPEKVRTDSQGEARSWLSGTKAELARVVVTSDRAPGLSEQVGVTLGGGLDATIAARQPACAGSVLLTGASEGATSFEWDWTGDGAADATGAVVTAPLPAGDHEVVLRVSEGGARAGIARATVSVLPAPAAVIDDVAPHVPSGATVQLDGTASGVTAGVPAFSWDLDGDGSEDAATDVVDWQAPDGLRTATLTVTDGNGCASTASVSILFGRPPDLRVSLVASARTALPGDVVRFDVGWGNDGPSEAIGAELGVTLTGPATFRPAGLPAGVRLASPTEAVATLDRLGVGAAGTFTLDVLAGNDFAGALESVTATARITAPVGDADPSDNTATDGFVVERNLDVSVAMTSPAANPLEAGAALPFEIAVTNHSPAEVPFTTVQLSWDDRLFLPPGALLGGTTGQATLDLGTLVPGEVRRIPIAGSVRPLLPEITQSLTLTASVYFAGTDRNTADNRAQLSRTVTAAPDLGVTLVATPSRSPARAGDRIDFTATWTQGGTTAAEGATMTATMTPGTLAGLLENPDGGVVTGNRITFNLGRAEPSASDTVRWAVQLAASLPDGLTTACTDVVVDERDAADRNAANDSASACTPVVIAPVLSVALSAPASAPAGGTATYVVTVTNAGARADAVDVELRLAGARAASGAASGDPLVLRTSLGSLDRGATRTWRPVVAPACPQLAVDPTLNAQAVVIHQGAEAAIAAHAMGVVARPDVVPVLTVPAGAAAGEALAGSVRVTNAGCAPCAAAGVDLTWDAALASSATPQPLVLGGAPLGAQAFTDLPFGLDVMPVLPGVVSSLSITSRASCPSDATGVNDSDTRTVPLGAAPDVAVTAVEAPATLAAGASGTVTVRLANEGSTAGSAQVSLASAGGLVSVGPPVVRAISAGATDSVDFPVTVASTLPLPSQPVSFVATTLTASDSDASDDAGSASTTLTASPDLEVVLALSTDAEPRAGSVVRATITVTNRGTTASTPGVITVTRDAALLLPLLPATAPASFTLPLPRLMPTAFHVATCSFVVLTPLPAGSITSTITASVDDPLDVDASNDSDDESVLFGEVVDLTADLGLTPGGDPLQAGQGVGVSVRVTNQGALTARGVRVVATWDPLLVGSVVQAIPGAIAAPGRLDWPLNGPPGDLAGNGAASTEGFTLRLADELPATSNVLSVSLSLELDPAANPERDLSDNADAASITAFAAADLCVTVTATGVPARPIPGGRLDYTVTVENRGTTRATAPSLALSTDPWLGAATAAGDGATAVGLTTWLLPPMGRGRIEQRTASFAIPAFLPAERTRTVSATATATAAEDGPSGCTGTSAALATQVTTGADLAVAIRLQDATEMPPRRGTRLTFEITVTNVGNSPTTSGGLVFRPPAETTVISSNPPGVSAGAMLSWGLGVIAPGGTQAYDVLVEVDGSLAPGVYVLRAEASVTSPQDANAGNDSASLDQPMNLDVDLVAALLCAPLPDPAVPGSPVQCTGTVVNQGSYAATNPRLAIDAGPLAVLDPAGTRTGTIAILPGGSAQPLQPGDSAPFSFMLRSLNPMPQRVNDVVVAVTAQADEPDADPADDGASATVRVLAWVDLHAELTASDVPPLLPGDEILMTLRLTNAGGTMPARPVAVTATYDPAIVDFVGGDLAGGGGTLSTTLGGAFDPLDPPSEAAVLTWRLRVKDSLPATQNRFTPCARGAAPGERLPNDDQDCVDELVALAWPDLRVTSLVAAPPSAIPGGTITYTAVVENVGSTVATAPVLVDDRPQDLTTAASPPASDDGDVVTVPLRDPLEPGGTDTVSWTVGVAASMPSTATDIVASPCARTPDGDADPANDCATVTVPVNATIDAGVALAVTAVSGSCTPGADVRLTITPDNQGSAPAPGARLQLVLPPGLVVVSAPGWTGAGPYAYDLASIPARTTLPPLVVLARVTPTLPSASNVLPVVVSVSHGAPASETNATNDSATVPLACLAWADPSVRLERLPPSPVPGGTVTYRVTWRNEGTTTAQGTTLTIADDAALLLPSGADPGAMGRTYALGNLAPGADNSASPLLLTYQVKPVLPAPTVTLTERVTIATATPAQDASDDVDEETDTIFAQADFLSTVSLAAAGAIVEPGDAVVATVQYANAGEVASDGTVTVLVDPGFVVESYLPATLSVNGNELTLPVTALAPGPGGAITLNLRVRGVLDAPAVNLAVLSLAESVVADQDASNDAGSASILGTASPDLVVSVRFTSPSPADVEAGGVLAGDVTVVNSGTTRATGAGLTLRPLDPSLVASMSCDDGTCGASAASLTWTLAPIAAGETRVHSFRIVTASRLPAASNVLTAEGRAFCNESELDGANNVATADASLTGRPDLRMVSAAARTSTVRWGQRVQVDWRYENVGSAPVDLAELHVEYDDVAMQFLQGTDAIGTAGALTFDAGTVLQPLASMSESAEFLMRYVPPPPNVRDLSLVSTAQERPPVGLSRDPTPADNAASVGITACYLAVRAHITANSQPICMGAGITLIADATPATNVTYSWFVEGGAGRFSSATGRTTTYFPPVTATPGSYAVHVVVADAASPACTAEAIVTVLTSASCASCGCSAAQFNVQYDAAFTRWDRFGDKSATQGETLSWRVQLRQTQNQRAGWLLGGPGNTRMTFSDGARTYTGWLSGDVWVECGQTYVVEFGPGTVPPDMTVGYHPIRFEFVTRDECGRPAQRDWDNNTGDRVQILAAPAGNSGITFTDWGPETEGAPGN